MPIIINGSTGISGVDGSAGTPAVIGSDADTGLLFSAGRVQASLNGTAANVGMVQGTAQNSTSGTNIDFTGIPSWARRITVMFNGVSLNGAADLAVRIGNGGTPQATSYTSAATILGNATTTASSTTGFQVTQSMAATDSASGIVTLCNVSGNVWTQSGLLTRTQGGLTASAGSVSLSGALDIVRVTGGTFDAGSINVFYE